MSPVAVRVVAAQMLSDLLIHALAAESDVAVVDLGATVVVIDAASCPEGWALALDRAWSGSPDARVVLLAEHDDAESAVAAAQAGVVGWMPPKVAVDELVSVIRAVADGEGVYPSRHLGEVLRAMCTASTRPGPTRGRLTDLTEREREVLQLLVEGLGSQECAESMHLSVNTVRTHTQRLFQRLKVHNRIEAVRVAHDLGLVPDRRQDPSGQRTAERSASSRGTAPLGTRPHSG